MNAQWIVIAFLVAGAILAAWVLTPQARTQRRRRRLFRDLARVNDLSAAESKWLWNFAIAADLEQPALVFLRFSLFADGCAQPGVDSTPAASVRAKLFGEQILPVAM